MSLTQSLERALFATAVKIYPHPVIRVHAESHKYLDHDLRPFAAAFGLRMETLERLRSSGADNPAYRFNRDGGLFRWAAEQREELKGASWLDVGAGTGCVDVYLSEIFQSEDFQLCDIYQPKNGHFPVQLFDGRSLDCPDNSRDLVIFSYVLHHASGNTINLLREAKRVARKFIIVLEDPKETKADQVWAFKHDKAGTFRSIGEWRALFELLELELVHEEALSAEVHSRHLFVLKM